MKKKILAVCLIVTLAATAIVGGTLAYFTDTDANENVFTVGNVDITLDETNLKAPEGDRVHGNTYENVAPTMTFTKDPIVHNEGSHDAYIRVDVTVSDATALLTAAEAHNMDLFEIFNGHDAEKWVPAAMPEVDVSANTVTYSFYYEGALAAGTDAAPIFESVTIPAAFTNEDLAPVMENGFSIDVTAHAIQAVGFGSVQDAFAAYEG